MRFVGAVVAFAGIATAFTPDYSFDRKNASTTTKVSSSVSSSKASSKPISLDLARPTPKVCGAKAVTVYETVYGAKANPTATRVASGYNASYSSKAKPSATKSAGGSKASPSAKVGKPFGYSEEHFRPKTEGDMKLKSCNHWSHNAKDPKNIIPTTVGEKTQIYYAENGKPRKLF
jgi:hypothetical protein